MAYRRRQGITRASTFKEEIIHHSPDHFTTNSLSSSSASLAAQAIRASVARRDSSLSSATATANANSNSNSNSNSTSSFASPHLRSKSFAAYDENSSSRSGFWGVLARKAKAILDEDNNLIAQENETPPAMNTNRFPPINSSTAGVQEPCQSSDNSRKSNNPTIRKGLDAITSSLNHLGDTFEKAFEEGRTIVENKTADLIQETRKIQIRRKGDNNSEAAYQASPVNNLWQQPSVQSTEPQIQTHHENQLKASRDVAMATAAKAKLLLRELKTIKADLAFAKERCTQLEEQNKILRENREKGNHRADDDLIRLQLETLLAEKARLAHENSLYARENRFLREIVEYHQLTMQDVVYLDEGMEEVTEVVVYPPSHMSSSSSLGITKMLSVSPPRSLSPTTSPRSPCADVKDNSTEEAPTFDTTTVSGEGGGTERALPVASSSC